jgi:phosphoglycolate phosphatase
VERYRDYFREKGMFENRVYDGIPEALGALSARFKLFVATSKPEPFAREILKHFGLAPHFAGIYGSRLEGALSWKADLIAYLLDEEGLSPYECLMVGDRAEDMRGAIENRLRAMGALWGYGGAEELQRAGAESLLVSPAELAGILGGKP